MTHTGVLHLPGHTPYARKLRSPRFKPVNGRSDEVHVPAAASVQWLLDQATWRFFDVAHLHSVELVAYFQLEELLERLGRTHKPLVFTVHDVIPNIEQDQPEFLRKTSLVISGAQAVSTLTPWARQQLTYHDLVDPARVEVLPHGYAIPPGHWPAAGPARPRLPTLGVYGALRPNRSVEAAIDLWRHLLGSTSFKGTFRLLLRSISGEDVERYPTILTKVMGLLGEDLASDVRLMSGVATDTEIVGFCRASSAILLPYRWVSHSGQLELAYDLGVPLIAPDLGGLTSQVTFHPFQTLPIHWFDAALLESDAGLRSLAQAVGMFLHRQPESSAERERAATYRREEHTDIIERHAVLYHAERD